MGFESSALKKFFCQFQNVFFYSKIFLEWRVCLCTGQSYNGQWKTQTVDCRLWTRVKMQTESKQGGCKIQNEDCRLGENAD